MIKNQYLVPIKKPPMRTEPHRGLFCGEYRYNTKIPQIVNINYYHTC